MDTMNRQQLSQLRGQAAQLIRKYRIPLLVFLLGVALVLIPSRTKKEEPQQTSAEAAETDFNLSATQKQLETLLSAIDGAGRVRLMLTLVWRTDRLSDGQPYRDHLRQHDAGDTDGFPAAGRSGKGAGGAISRLSAVPRCACYLRRRRACKRPACSHTGCIESHRARKQ